MAHHARVKRLAAFALGMTLGASALAQEVRGAVFEVQNPEAPRAEWKRAASAGAFVIVHWTGRRPGLFHYESVCIQAAIARTDAQGRFEVAEPPPLRSTFLVFRNAPAVAVYKPGFEAANESRPEGARNEWLLAPSKVEAQQRAIFIEVMAHMGCRDAQFRLVLTDPQGLLPAFRDALAAESPRRE